MNGWFHKNYLLCMPEASPLITCKHMLLLKARKESNLFFAASLSENYPWLLVR